MALVAIAGPLTNFLIAFIAFLIGHFTGALYSSNELLSFTFLKLILINLGFMIFNLIPIPPLDGSRVLYAIAPDGFRNLLAGMEQYGFIIVYMLIFLFGEVFQNIMVSGMGMILEFFYLLVRG